MTGYRVMIVFFDKGLTRNAEIGNTPPKFCPISEEWGELRIPSFARMPLMKCYSMLQNVRVTALTVSELLRENQQAG